MCIRDSPCTCGPGDHDQYCAKPANSDNPENSCAGHTNHHGHHATGPYDHHCPSPHHDHSAARNNADNNNAAGNNDNNGARDPQDGPYQSGSGGERRRPDRGFVALTLDGILRTPC